MSAGAAPDGDPLPNLFPCTPDKKERLLGLVKAYFQQLKHGCGDSRCTNKDCASSGEHFEHAAATDAELFEIARGKLAKDAFRQPPVFHFCPAYCYPTGAMNHAILTADRVHALIEAASVEDPEAKSRGSAELAAYLEDAFSVTSAPWAFLSVRLLRAKGDVYSEEEGGNAPTPLHGGGCLGIDLPEARRALRALDGRPEMHKVIKKLMAQILKLATEIPRADSSTWRDVLVAERAHLSKAAANGTPPSGECAKLNGFLTWRLARLFLLLFECPSIVHWTVHLCDLCVALATLNRFLSAPMINCWANYKSDKFHVVAALQTHVTMTLLQGSRDGESELTEATCNVHIPAACIVLSMLFEANFVLSDAGIVSYKQFYNDAINERISPTSEFERWMQLPTGHIRDVKEEKLVPRTLGQTFKNAATWYREEYDGISNSSPFVHFTFLLNATFKHILLQGHSKQQQTDQVRRSLMNFSNGVLQPADESLYLILHVNREDMIRTTLMELNRNRNKMRRPLRVQFKNEEGIDEGGVKKEFFQLVIRQLVDPAFGMFTENEDTHTHWFQPRIICSHNDIEYHLIGKMVGLAIYNQVILDINFPGVAYKKLLYIEPDFDDLKDLDPELYHSFKALLAFDEEKEGATVEDTFCTSFTVTHDVFGEKVEVEIIPGGKDVPLTKANRQEYVDRYVQYLFHDSIGKNFSEFQNGFFEVCGMQGELLKTFHPEELEQMVVGCPMLDLGELEKTTRYVGLVLFNISASLKGNARRCCPTKNRRDPKCCNYRTTC
ncbi:putative E3 ubiquitin-protein ligase mug30 [Diplonema papillatum]|nr:putative E3 ubiquitin-protein ligase mug30 [Diplonema papillatum]